MPGNFSDRGSRGALPGFATPVHGSRARVLVVDDHCTYRLLLGSLLEKLGVAHQACCNGQQALHVLAAEHFDLVISDCRMPVLDGYAMTRELRRLEQAAGREPIIVLALTASLGAEEIRRCAACGMDGWLTKPIGLAQLRDVLRCWLPPRRPTATAGSHMAASSARISSFPSRGSLINVFGSWDVVEPMLSSLVQEAHADLTLLMHAQVTQDVTIVAQCLHRLVGSVAFLGETGLEAAAVELINAVHNVGIAPNESALDAFREAVERYLDYLSHL